MHTVKVGDVTFSNTQAAAFICGPCAIEGREKALRTAEAIAKIAKDVGVGLVYKSSFDKANRTAVSGGRGVGMEEGLRILEEVRNTTGLPVLTDIHEKEQCAPVGEVVDILQIPAFLSRQTDLLVAAANTGKTVNIKKGQFMAPQDMAAAAGKVTACQNNNILLTERGTTFGYNNLVVDMRSYPIMAQTGFPVIHDATHCVMMPSVHGGSSGGKREFVEPLARAAAAIGIGGFFIEAHLNPAEAISDKETQVPVDQLAGLLRTLKQIDAMAKELSYQNIQSAA